MASTSHDDPQDQEKELLSMTPPEAPEEYKHSSGPKLALVLIPLYISMFLVALVGLHSHPSFDFFYAADWSTLILIGQINRM